MLCILVLVDHMCSELEYQGKRHACTLLSADLPLLQHHANSAKSMRQAGLCGENCMIISGSFGRHSHNHDHYHVMVAVMAPVNASMSNQHAMSDQML